MMIKIEVVTTITSQLVAAVATLMPQLTNSSSTSADTDYLKQMLESQTTTLFVAKVENKIVGMLCLVIYTLPSGKKSWIEDVVVDYQVRGRGIAQQLIAQAFVLAKAQGVEKIDLTSNSQRVVAHKLYLKLGFEKRDTSVFRKILD